MSIIPLFSIPATIINIGREFTETELQLFLSDITMFKEKEMTNHRSKDLYLFDSFNKELEDIKSFCEQQFNTYLEEIEGADTDLATLRITESWLNKTKPGEHHHSHFHANSYLSGILYISCLPNDHINFSNRLHGLGNNMEFPRKKSTVWNVNTLQQNVTEGDLIIFPSWIIHYVDWNETKNMDRISLAFNSFPTGTMGKCYGSRLML
tara:strand:- start:149 stop:772 length:624 start_codon:yes stop_codon:yes gene_type:complete